MSDDEIAAYQAHPKAFFGEVSTSGGRKDDPYDLFEWFLECYADTQRPKLLELIREHPDFERLSKLEDNEIRLAMCEAWTVSAIVSAEKRRAEPAKESPQ